VAAKLKIKQVRSTIGRTVDQKRTIRALGLRKLNQVVVHGNTPSIRGMVAKVRHLVDVQELDDE
jgi:large subunit ribosomal protein L30